MRKDCCSRWWPGLPSSNSGLSAAALGTAWFGVCVRAGLEPADRDDLVPGSDLDGEGRGSEVQDSIGAVIGLLQGCDDAAIAVPEEEGEECVCVCVPYERYNLIWGHHCGLAVRTAVETVLFFAVPKSIYCFYSTVSGCDGGKRTRNIAVYTWRFSPLSCNRHV